MKNTLKRIMVVVLVLIMSLSAFSIFTSAYTPGIANTHTIFRHTEQVLAPGVDMYTNYAYANDGEQNVYFVATADISRDDVIVQTSYKDQFKDGNLGMSRLTDQIAFANEYYSDSNSPQFVSEYYNVVAGVNASFFSFSTGQPTGVCSIDGVDFGTNAYPAFFAILENGTAVIDARENKDKYNIWQAVGGSDWLVRNGQDITYNSTDRYSRTAVGVTADGKVVLMSLDGRQSPYSIGGSLHEIAQIMIEADCVAAINLDGGGSTTFVAKENGNSSVKIINRPSDGAERPISTGLIIASTAVYSNPYEGDVLSNKVEFDGHYYKVFDDSISWSNAKAYCESIGGHLATVNSQQEQDFLTQLANNNSKTNYWIGAYPVNGVFHWVTGEDFSYTNWASGEPNNVFNMQNAVMMYTKRASYPAGTWNDENENGRDWTGYELSSIGYICEWDENESIILSERIIANGKKTNYYGAITYETSKAGEVQDAAIEFNEALELYFNAFCAEGQKKIGNTTSMVSLEDLAKKLRKQDESTTDKYITMTESSIPSDCLDSVYYALASFLTNVINNKVDLGKIDFSKDSTTNAVKIVNAVQNGMQGSGNNTFRKGNYEITFNTFNMWSAFTGTVTVKKISGLNSGTTYSGVINSTMAGTQKVLVTYMDCMSDIVKDACKYALFSILSELRNVTYLAEFERTELESFLSNKVSILQKKGYGDVLTLFLNVRTGYKTIKPFLIAKDSGSLSIVLSNAQSMYNAINEMDFSTKGINKKAVKEAVKEVEKARKKLANKLYNYIYNTDVPVEEEEGVWSWIKKNIFGIKCPVEFEIYDNSGNLIGYVDSSDKHEDYIWYTDEIYIELNGDSKFVYAPVDMGLNFKFTAIDDGVMNYTIEYQDGDERIERLNYFDVPLSSGDTYEQCIPANTVLMAIEELPLVGDSEINFDSYLSSEDLNGHINVTCESENGLVIGEGPYPIGDLVQLVALKDYDDYTFKGWYIDDTIVETSEIYRFTAKEDVTVKAVFEKRTDIDHSYTTTYSDDYSDSYVELIKQPNERRSVYIAVPSIGINDVALTSIRLFNDADELTYSSQYEGEAISEYEIMISDLVLDDAGRIEILDGNDKLIATLAKNDLTVQQIVLDKDDLAIEVNESIQINVLPVPATAQLPDIRWESTHPEIATVDDSGIVTAVSVGKTIIKCFALDSEISVECEVTARSILGDVDGDEEVGVIDATYIQRYEAGFNIPISEEDILLRGDVDGDEEVTVIDATYIQRYDAGFNIPYPIGELIS